MFRCESLTRSLGTQVGAALLALACVSAPLVAQAQSRQFPATALRGTLQITQFPDALLNGQPVRLAPGSRVRGQNNLLVLPASITGQQLAVNYTVGFEGLVKDVWLLTRAEQAVSPWPTTPDQASRWLFDPAAQTWTVQ